MAPILIVDNLVKKYGDFEAVKGVSFSVEEGEVFGLLGPNGAGKTTVISMLTGVLQPTSGTAHIGGYDINTQLSQAKRICGLVPQDLALYPTLSARANLNFFGRIYGLSGRDLKERVDNVLHVVALADRADDTVQTFSGGMKRRVNIAAGLVHQPRLLFLDEPTVGVDPQSRNHIFESVLHLHQERGMSIIYTSHYMEEVELLCTRVAIIDQGKIIALDTIENLIAMLGGGIINVGLTDVNEDLLTRISDLPAVQEVTMEVRQPAAQTSSGEEVEPGRPITGSMHTPLVKIMAEHSQQALVNLISFLQEQDIQVTSLNILEPNLENVFLHLTGKTLRD